MCYYYVMLQDFIVPVYDWSNIIPVFIPYC